jgi:hypothetical protein
MYQIEILDEYGTGKWSADSLRYATYEEAKARLGSEWYLFTATNYPNLIRITEAQDDEE